MEVEAKFSISNAEALRHLQAVEGLVGYHLSAPARIPVHDTYLDTDDWRIMAAGYACRLREEDNHLLFALKAFSDPAGAIHRREELEIPVPPGRRPAEWPPSEARDRLLDIAGGAPLNPLFHIRQERHVRRVTRGERTVAEWSLDEVTISIRGEEETFIELEIELVDQGTQEDLAAISAYLGEQPGLTPETRSKFERALALRTTSPALPPRLTTPGLLCDDDMAEAARKILLFQFQKMVLNEAGTLIGEDIEALHDMRVATRRMRAAFRIFRRYLNEREIAPHLKRLRETGRALGTVRDLDVFWEKAQHYRDELPPERRSELEPLHAAWKVERQRARQKMLAYLSGRDYAQFKASFGEFLTTPGAGARPILNKKGGVRPHRLRTILPAIVYRRLARVMAYDGWVTAPDTPPERLHRLRIAAKRLRYTLEFFHEVLGADTGAVIAKIKDLQDHLGAIQDAVVASDLVWHLLEHGHWMAGEDDDAPPEPIDAPGVKAYLVAKQNELKTLRATFPQTWTWFQGPELNQMIAACIQPLEGG